MERDTELTRQKNCCSLLHCWSIVLKPFRETCTTGITLNESLPP